MIWWPSVGRLLPLTDHSSANCPWCSTRLSPEKLLVRNIVNWKIPWNSVNKPWAYMCSKGLFGGLVFGGTYYWREFCVSKWDGLDSKNSLKRWENSLKQLNSYRLQSMGLYLGGFIIKRIFASVVRGGGNFLRIIFRGREGALIITILRYRRAVATTIHIGSWEGSPQYS